MTFLSRNPIFLVVTLLLAFAGPLLLGEARRAEALTNCTVSSADLTFDAEEQNFLTMLNAYRAQNGAGPLTASVNINRASAWMARNNADRTDTPSHTDTLGRDPLTRMQQCDSVAPGANIAENIAGGPSATGSEILAQFQASPPHNATMLNPAYRQIGVARAFNAANAFPWEWVTNFSTIDDGTRAGQPLSNPSVNVESPQAGNVPASFQVSGWAADLGATADDGIDQVHVYIYAMDANNNLIQPQVFFAPATFPQARPDVANAFGANFLNSGFALVTSPLQPGKYQIVVLGHSKISNAWTPVTRNVTVQGVTSNPLTNIDTPTSGNAPGSFAVSGWSIDTAAPSGTGIDMVHVYIYPTDANGKITGSQVFFSPSTYGGNRPDVAAAEGGKQQFTPSGFTVNVPQMQAGGYLIAVYSHSTVSQQWTVVARQITVQGPLMSIDGPNGTTGASFTVSGWAIDRAAVSNDGVDNVHVYLYKTDANGNATQPQVFFSPASFGGSRPDVAGIYGQQFAKSAFSLTVPAQQPGNYLLVAYMHSSVSNSWSGVPRNITVGTTQQVAPTTPTSADHGDVPNPVAGPGSTAPVAPPTQAPVQAPPAPAAIPGRSR